MRGTREIVHGGKQNDGWQVQSRLLTKARPGGVAEVDSETVKGSFKITSLTHRLDNRKGPFHTILRLRDLAQ